MTLPSPRAFAAFVLLAASAARAAPARDARESRRTLAEAWQDGAGSPENFPRFAEGSRERRGAVPDPSVAARSADPYARKPTLRPFVASSPIRLDLPPLPSPGASARSAAPAREAPFNSLAACGLAGGLGCLLLALGGASVGSTAESSPRPTASESSSLPARPRSRSWARLAESVSPAVDPVADWSAPIASWRAISWREQELIDGWDRSPEKARGRATFFEWLDARENIDGVDVPRLKAKLDREAA